MLKRKTQLKQTPLKRKNSTLTQKGALRKTSTLKRKPATDDQKKEQQEQYEKDWEFYREIWSERPHYSEVSGKYLGEELKSYMIEHLLEKSMYPHLRYEKDNIALVTFEEQTMKTNGYPLPKHKELIERAKKKYNII